MPSIKTFARAILLSSVSTIAITNPGNSSDQLKLVPTQVPNVFSVNGIVTPPEPDAFKSPRSHEGWSRAKKAMESGIKDRSSFPKAYKLPVQHTPAKATQAQIYDSVNSTLNWSGTVITGAAESPLEVITATFTVPIGQQAFGTCTQTPSWVSLWAGIDGANDPHVLQAGVSISATCTQVNYAPWLEWFPAPAVAFNSPVISPGDLVFVEIWSTTPSQGWVVFYNYTTNISAEYGVSAPDSGSSLVGSSVEWIIERPGAYPNLTSLANYISSSWIEGSAWNYTNPHPTLLEMGKTPSQGSLTQDIMLDDKLNPISSATIENEQFLLFLNYGSSCGLAAGASNNNATPC